MCFRLLPNSAAHDALSYEDAVMLSNVDSRLLSPEPESLCRLGIIDDSDQNEIAEKSRFEDTLISRLVIFLVIPNDFFPLSISRHSLTFNYWNFNGSRFFWYSLF